MKAPSIKNLLASFPKDLDADKAQLIRDLCAVVDAPQLRDLIEERCPQTWIYLLGCHSNLLATLHGRRTLVLHAVDVLLGTHGVEPLGKNERPPFAPPYEYCNAGDSYAQTLIYRRSSDRLFVGCWADLVERHPKLGE